MCGTLYVSALLHMRLQELAYMGLHLLASAHARRLVRTYAHREARRQRYWLARMTDRRPVAATVSSYAYAPVGTPNSALAGTDGRATANSFGRSYALTLAGWTVNWPARRGTSTCVCRSSPQGARVAACYIATLFPKMTIRAPVGDMAG